MKKIDTEIENLVNETIDSFAPIFIDEDNYKKLLQHCKPYPFLSTSKGIATLVKKKSGNKGYAECKIQPIASFVRVKYRLHNVDTEEISLVLEIDNGIARVEKEFARTILSKMEIKALLTYGVKFLESYSDLLLSYLIKTESSAGIRNVHTSLGWTEIGNTPVFKCSEILYPSNSSITLKSSYRGNLDLHPKGCLDVWLNMVKSEVIGNVPLTVTLLLSFASPILAYVTEKYDLGSLLFCISNESSRGKTTSGALVASVFSNPCLNKATMRTFNATQNFIVSFLAQTSGLPVVFDEASEFSGNMEQLLYLLSSGCEKGRLDGNSEMKSEKSWRSIILTTSEFHLFSEDTAPNGLKARCFEIPDQLTSSAENSDTIKTTIASNYGVAGKAYLQFLLNEKMDSLEHDYLKAKKQLIQESLKAGKTSPLTKRILSKLAVILVAARYVRKCFGLNINIVEIKAYLLNMERQVSIKTDIIANSLDIILQEISRNSLRFLTPDRPSGQNIVGKISEDEKYKTISILKTEFQAYCSKNKIQNPHKVLTGLKAKGILQCEKDRLTKRIRLNDFMPIQTCYILRIPDAKSLRRQPGNKLPKLTSNDELDF